MEKEGESEREHQHSSLCALNLPWHDKFMKALQLKEMASTMLSAANRCFATVEPTRPIVNTWKLIDAYERKLRCVAFLAVVATALQNLSQFLGFCGLTWATVVVLGGYVTDLSRDDYYLVTILLLLEASRLGAAIFFGNLVTKKLVYLSPIPTKLEYHDSKRQVIVAIIRIMDQACQLILIAISILLPLLRLRHLFAQRVVLSGLLQEPNFCGLGDSLVLFYTLVLGSAIVAGFAVLYSKSFVLLYVTTASLQRYFDEIVCRGWNESLLKASEFDFLAFAFRVQAEEYLRNVQPVVLCEVYKDMLEYLYVHEKGAEAARIALESGDSHEQQAAANILGLWVAIEQERGKKTLRFKKRLLAEIVKAAGGEGKTGRAAVTSLEKLAEWDCEGVMQIRSEEDVARVLTRAIRELVEGEEPNETLVYVKAMIELLPKCGQTVQKRVGVESWERLRKDLRRVWENPKSRVRTTAVAGWALLKMKADEIEAESAREHLVKKVVSAGGEYVHREKELDYVLHLLKIGGQEGFPHHWKTIEIRTTHPEKRPKPLLATRRTMLLSGLLNFLIITMAINSLLRNLAPSWGQHYIRNLVSSLHPT